VKIGRVVNNIWSTRKDESLVGLKLMIVQLIEKLDNEEGNVIVAVDLIGAGIGERVLITQGSSARRMKELENVPVDALIVGIIDEGQEEP
jgi:ethanolamine utilization protein EutN